MHRSKRVLLVSYLIAGFSLCIFASSIFFPQIVATTIRSGTTTRHVIPSDHNTTSTHMVILQDGEKCVLGAIQNTLGTTSFYLVRTNTDNQVVWSKVYSPAIRSEPIGVAESSASGCIIFGRIENTINNPMYWALNIDANGYSAWNKTMNLPLSTNHIIPIEHGLVLPSIISSSNGSVLHLQEMNDTGKFDWATNITLSEPGATVLGGIRVEAGISFVLQSTGSSIRIITTDRYGNLLRSNYFILDSKNLDYVEFTYFGGNYYIVFIDSVTPFQEKIYLTKLSDSSIDWNKDITKLHLPFNAKLAVTSHNIFIIGCLLSNSSKSITSINTFDTKGTLIDHYNTTSLLFDRIDQIGIDQQNQLIIFGTTLPEHMLYQLLIVRLSSNIANYINSVHYLSGVTSGLFIIAIFVMFFREKYKKKPNISTSGDLLYRTNE